MNASPARWAGTALARPRLSIRPPRLDVVGPELPTARTSTTAPPVVAYRVESAGHRQTGLVVEVAVEDYRHDRIRRHEATRPEQVRELDELAETTGSEQVPVTLTYPVRSGPRPPLEAITSATPDVVHTDAGGVTHSVWTRHEPEVTRDVHDELDRVAALYIADGHHRMAAADRRANRRGRAEFTLAAVFPSDEMRVLGYHRSIARPASTRADVLAALSDQPMISGIEECSAETARTAPGIALMCLDGTWYRISLRTLRGAADVRSSLDVVALDENILPRAFGPTGGQPAATRLPAEDPHRAARWCAETGVIGFLPHPPGVEQIMAVSDAGQLMPPKSTWFDPKASAEVFTRPL